MPIDDDDEKSLKSSSKMDKINISFVLDKSEALSFLKIEGDSILSLPEKSKKDDT